MIEGMLLFLWLYASIVVHECGHYAAAKATGVMTSHVEIGTGPLLFKFVLCNDNWRFYQWPWRGKVVVLDNCRWKKMLAVLSAGPLASFALALLAYYVLPGAFAIIPLLDGIFNLVPNAALKTDGYRIRRLLWS